MKQTIVLTAMNIVFEGVEKLIKEMYNDEYRPVEARKERCSFFLGQLNFIQMISDDEIIQKKCVDFKEQIYEHYTR